MIGLSQLNSYLDELMMYDKKLNLQKIDPIMTNGIMVKGKETIKKIGFGVSASLGFFQKAKQTNCDALIVHHTFNYPTTNRYDEIFQKRIGYLITHNISLFGYHFLLDAHPIVGNNAVLLKTIGATNLSPYLHRGNAWGWVGTLPKAKTLGEIVSSLTPYLSSRKVVYDFGKKDILTVAAVSGKGAPFPTDMQNLIEGGVDLFITGEIHEWNKELFKEAGIHCIAGGHYMTETAGIKALMGNIERKFPDVVCEWIDYHNDV